MRGVAVILALVAGLTCSHAQSYDLSEVLRNDVCVMSGFSSNHFIQALNLVLSTQKFHPCLKMYIHDLGLSPHERAVLESFPFITMREFKMGNEMFPGGACAFKPPLILNFMKAYGIEHNCRFILYGDASITMYNALDNLIIDELIRVGLVADISVIQNWQVSFTHPAMYPFFGFDREEDYHSRDKMKQTQAGLLMVDAKNATIRDTFFTEWAACAANPACLTPDNITTNKRAPNRPTDLFPMKDGTKVFRYVLL